VITLMCRSFARALMDGSASPADKVPFMIRLLTCTQICSQMGLSLLLLIMISMHSPSIVLCVIYALVR
jgi:hypothetical protein